MALTAEPYGTPSERRGPPNSVRNLEPSSIVRSVSSYGEYGTEYVPSFPLTPADLSLASHLSPLASCLFPSPTLVRANGGDDANHASHAGHTVPSLACISSPPMSCGRTQILWLTRAWDLSRHPMIPYAIQKYVRYDAMKRHGLPVSDQSTVVPICRYAGMPV